GGVFLDNTTLELSNSIIALNESSSAKDLLNGGTVNLTGVNIISDLTGSSLSAGAALLEADPLIAPLANYGGPVPTMHPLSGSPAIDPAGGHTGSIHGGDARGFPRIIASDPGVTPTPRVDIGAVEVGPIRVVTTSADENDGVGVGAVSLRDAIAEASPGQIIRFDPAVFNHPDRRLVLAKENGPMIVNTSVFIDGSGLPVPLTIDGADETRILTVQGDGSATLGSMTLSGGRAGLGGAILVNAGGALTLDQMVLRENTADQKGGAISSKEGSIRIRRTTITGNHAGLNGGGIDCQGGSVELMDTTFSHNRAGRGGALHLDAGTVVATNCTVAENVAGMLGGGIASEATEAGCLHLINTTVARNRADSAGGGVHLIEGQAANLDNMIVATNEAPSGPDILVAGGGPVDASNLVNLIGNNEGSGIAASGLVGTPGAPVDPKLSLLGFFGGPVQTMHPLVGSPAIHAGSVSYEFSPPHDARGFDRVVPEQGSFSILLDIDLGAVEAGEAIVVNTAADENDGAGTGGVSLRDAIAAADSPNDRIVFDPAVFTGGTANLLTLTEGQLLISGGMFLDAANIPDGITIDANGATTGHRVLEISSGDFAVAMDSFTLTGGVGGSDGGGAVLSEAGDFTLLRSRVTGNQAGNLGGGIAAYTSRVALESVWIDDNDAVRGGGIACFHGEIFNSTISGNHATIVGGGLWGGELLLIANTTISGNSSVDEGGGVYAIGRMRFGHSTIAGNSSENQGGGIFSAGTSTLEISHSIVAANTAPASPDIANSGGTVIANGANLIGNHSSVETEFPAGLLVGTPGGEVDPLLSPLADFGGPVPTRYPLGGSPAIDPDTSTTRLLISDARGFGDEANGAVDLGAVETDQVIPGFSPVVDSASDDVDGLFGAGQTTLREAIALAPEGSTITFDGGLSGETLELVESELIIAKDLTLDASALSGGFTIKAAPDSRVLLLPDSETQAVIVSIAFTGGNLAAPAAGGAISNAGDLILTDVTVSGNAAGSGGGISNSGSLTLNESRIVDNRATGYGGGGIFSSQPDSQLTLEGTTISNNSAPTGGGITVFGGILFRISNSTIFHNAAHTAGGGIYAFSAGGTNFVNTTLTGNTAPQGAGFWLGGSAGITNTTVAGNAASGAGGGIYLTSLANFTFENSIVAGNTAGLGGADFLRDGGGATLTPTGINLVGSNETVESVLPAGPFVGTPANVLDPRLSPLSDFGGPVLTLHPLADSLAIDPTGGATSSSLAGDARGRPRMVDGDAPIDGSVVLDLGAVEAGPTIQVTTQIDENNGIGVQGISLREALAEVADFGVVRFVPALFNGEPGDVIRLDPAFGQLSIGKSLFIDASNIPGGVMIDADIATEDHRVMLVQSPATRLVMDSLVLTGGNFAGSGGCLRMNAGVLTMNRVQVSVNRASQWAGGIFLVGGKLVMNESEVSGNVSQYFPGVYVSTGALFEARGSLFSGNVGDVIGGGVANFGTARIWDSTIRGNTAQYGGGLYSAFAAATTEMRAVSFIGNEATIHGGGLLVNGGHTAAANCTFAGNTSPKGGAVFNQVGSLDLEFATISGNSATGAGGNLLVNGTTTISNSIVAGNEASFAPDVHVDSSGTLVPTGLNLIGINQGAEAVFPPSALVGTPAAPLDPLLKPLGDNGGLVETLLPAALSPAVDPAGGDTTALVSTDARGRSRLMDGDTIAGAIADLGAVELGTRLVVTTLQDQNDSYLVDGASLREALEVADGLIDTIVFDPSVFNGTDPGANRILLTEGEIEVDKPVSIDASGIPSGITVDGGGASRILLVQAGGSLSLDTVSLTGGNALGNFGGGIYSFGSVALRNGSVHDNSAGVGGGIYNRGILELENATFFGNSAGTAGGAVQSSGGSVHANHVTIVGNTVGAQLGGGIRLYQGATLEIANSIVAGNTAPTGPDISIQTPGVETITALGGNLIGNNGLVATEFPEDGVFVGGGSLPPVHPMLAPLGDYGGSSLTMPPLPGSSAIEGAELLTSTPALDQRGAVRPGITGIPDLGAVEAQPISFLATTDADGDGIADLLEGPGGPFPHLTPGVDDSLVDTDGDGSTDAEEIANMTDLFDANDRLRILSFVRTGEDGSGNPMFDVSFSSYPGLSYSIEMDERPDFPVPQVSELGSAIGYSTETTVTLPQGDSGFLRVRRD
ncbi:MAG: hypothetical protein H7A48_14310, partial [Akkermansiaceae bacterium]|nr:hypothetical protein [Akkermansiaceae bacterium]